MLWFMWSGNARPPASFSHRPMRARLAIMFQVLALASISVFALIRFDSEPALLLEGVPDVVQTTNYSCGPSAVVALLAYYGIAADEQEIIREAKTDPKIGAELEDLADVVQRRGLQATVCEGLDLADLERELKARYPVLILNQSWRDNSHVPWDDDWDDGHYLLVIGISAVYVFVEDPVLKGSRGLIPRSEFVARWHDWTIDKRRAWGQALLVHGSPRPRRAASIARFERVR